MEKLKIWKFYKRKKGFALKHELKCEQHLIMQEESETFEILFTKKRFGTKTRIKVRATFNYARRI